MLRQGNTCMIKSGKQDTGSVVYERKEWTDDDRSHRTCNVVMRLESDPAVSSCYQSPVRTGQNRTGPGRPESTAIIMQTQDNDFVVAPQTGVREPGHKNKIVAAVGNRKNCSYPSPIGITAGWKIVITQ